MMNRFVPQTDISLPAIVLAQSVELKRIYKRFFYLNIYYNYEVTAFD